ncbi:30S ribosomal protein S5 [Candidatus Portiera aleyrodidarum]|uniref:Small ribosomal subunit protein uS5 n=1 Tax=Candidatus Portiera aleyrodidarum MED (Bemisia tabaci) TaxID=1163752 RepID=A0AAU8S775_9GAMM|nr:30S ribosomal protein S5 [Candidatus Portiera aleyrodidarum]AFQ24062.1 SSU ribosomal protein S5P [Candidatus Portiera aleyrodidarum BT-B-HRs]AFS18826.1 30S ribosomal protein S5 [Candidatus Portiera aleyrodidarum BT-QVLC]AFT80452.1 SSU ribosomal protein S5p (S2e) [Candidatus Portiera aleyrodidarum BT-QVLC]AFT80733.1 SSU ribosomal protein S5p (S2e) [Candidatus Portiera aleyrodidarum BT-B-HRs]AJF24039.1 30S ribosomal protein S5 [Candidatus Portiera aleyrodidarum MED (Bemisia tabaci)]
MKPENNKKKRETDFKEKLVKINRVSKVVKGGRIFGFSATIVIGNGKGKIGLGKGKAREVSVAIQKAIEKAKRKLFVIKLKGDTLQHKIYNTYGASKIYMQPAYKGTGIIAGGAMRSVLEIAGIYDVLAKCYGSTNPINVVKATLNGLKKMYDSEYIQKKRGVDKIRSDLDT